MKVALCIPSGGTVYAAFAASLAALTAYSDVPMTLLSVESSLIAHDRDRGVAAAREQGYTHVLFLDSDMVFPPDALHRLLAHDKDIVGCVYKRRVAPHGVLGNLVEPQSKGLTLAYELGMGCMLIKLSVFDKLEAPFFRTPAIPSFDKVPPELDGFWLDDCKPPTLLGEDYYFCKAARRAGFYVFADLGLSAELGHIGTTVHVMEG